jgi:hypothetical protein
MAGAARPTPGVGVCLGVRRAGVLSMFPRPWRRRLGADRARLSGDAFHRAGASRARWLVGGSGGNVHGSGPGDRPVRSPAARRGHADQDQWRQPEAGGGAARWRALPGRSPGLGARAGGGRLRSVSPRPAPMSGWLGGPALEAPRDAPCHPRPGGSGAWRARTRGCDSSGGVRRGGGGVPGAARGGRGGRGGRPGERGAQTVGDGAATSEGQGEAGDG